MRSKIVGDFDATATRDPKVHPPSLVSTLGGVADLLYSVLVRQYLNLLFLSILLSLDSLSPLNGCPPLFYLVIPLSMIFFPVLYIFLVLAYSSVHLLAACLWSGCVLLIRL